MDAMAVAKFELQRISMIQLPYIPSTTTRHSGLTIINALCLVVSRQDSARRRRSSIAGVTIYCAVCVMSGDGRRRLY